MIVEKGPAYKTGGVTTLMSVGDELSGDTTIIDIIKVTGFALAGYFIGRTLEPKKAKLFAIASAGVGLLTELL